MLKHIWHALQQVFDLLPDFVAFVITAIGIAIIFMNEVLTWLGRRPRSRYAVGFGCTCIGILALVSNQVQKGQDKSDKTELSKQIRILVNTSQTQATTSDIRGLSGAISNDLQKFKEAVLRSRSAPQIVSQPKTSSPPQQNPGPGTPAVLPSSTAPRTIRFTQKRVPSTDLQNPFALQIIVQSDSSITPVGLALTFTGPISNIDFFLAGQPIIYMEQNFVFPPNPKIGVVRVGSPALGPDTPMVVTVVSKENINFISGEQISPAINAPFSVK